MEHCSKMDDLKMVAQTLSSTKKSLIDEIKSALKCLNSVESELREVKSDAISLQKMNKQIEFEFSQLEEKYFQKKSAR